VPKEPTEEMVDKGAQGMASFQEESVWPDSWEPLQVRQMKHDAKKAYRYMLAAAPKKEEGNYDELHEEIYSLRAQLAECQKDAARYLKEARQLRESLIGWRERAWPHTDQRVVIDKDYPITKEQSHD